MKILIVHTIMVSIFITSCASQPANAQSGGEPVFTVTTKNQDDQIDIRQENSITIFDIYSPTGIGTANFELESGSMPEKLILRLHLTGLEEFRLVSNQTTIVSSGSSSDVFNVTSQSVIAAGNEYFITPIDPSWTKVEIVSGKPDKKIPLEEGFFEITVPKEFIRSAGNSFEIQWIDFYR